MLGLASLGAVLAGAYGIAHDQLTYSISPEYFTRLKFPQFASADFGLAPRLFVAEIGVLATWWVGFLVTWFLARIAVPAWPRPLCIRRVFSGVAITFGATALAVALGFLYGLSLRSAAMPSPWRELTASLGVNDAPAFVRVAYIHNAGYLGALAGLLLALAYLLHKRRIG